MTREEKIKYALNDLAQRGVKKYTAAPPLYRGLWRLGFYPPPPLFANFWSNAFLMGVSFAVLWGVMMCLTVWWDQPKIEAIIASIVSGALFGLSMAGYYWWRWRKLGLPRWKDYPSARA